MKVVCLGQEKYNNFQQIKMIGRDIFFKKVSPICYLINHVQISFAPEGK
jgi:hypothetical protein